MLRSGRNFALIAAHKLDKLTPFHGFIKIIAYRPPQGGAGIAPLKLLKLLRKSMLEKACIHAGFREWLRTVLPPFAHRSTPLFCRVVYYMLFVFNMSHPFFYPFGVCFVFAIIHPDRALYKGVII